MWLAFLLLIAVLLWLLSRVGCARIRRRLPARGKFIDVERARLHYTVSGQGRPLVCLHGASANGQDFAASIGPALAESFQVITVDRPGMGYSTRQDPAWCNPLDQANAVRELVQHLELKDPVLVAHSWSGALALCYLLHYPREIAGAVLLSPATSPWPSPAALHNRISRWPLVGPLFVNLLVYPLGSLALDRGIRSAFYRGRVPEDYRRRSAIDLLLCPRSWRANADDLCLLSGFLEPQSRLYEMIRHPLLAIIGDHDNVVSNEIHTVGLKRKAPQMQVVSLAECGHAPHHEHPEAVTRMIREFAASLEPAATTSS